jgi:hypothetical protein
MGHDGTPITQTRFGLRGSIITNRAAMPGTKMN